SLFVQQPQVPLKSRHSDALLLVHPISASRNLS
ncbi:hypothetical protein PF004_g6011, partial [Phytophthora fragariae]